MEGLLIGSLAEPLTRSLRLLKYARIKITVTEVRTKVHYKIDTVTVELDEVNWNNVVKEQNNLPTQLPNGNWIDAEGLPLPVPPSVGASGRVPKVLQSGGNTLTQSTANALNKYFGENINKREWGRALESLKKDNNIRNDHHGRILDNGDYINSSGNVIGNIGEYLK